MAARFDELERRGNELAGRRRPGTPEPTEIHRRLVATLSDVLKTISNVSKDGVPTPILVAARAVRHMQGELLESIADVPEETVRNALLDIRGRIDSVLNAPDDHTRSDSASQS